MNQLGFLYSNLPNEDWLLNYLLIFLVCKLGISRSPKILTLSSNELNMTIG